MKLRTIAILGCILTSAIVLAAQTLPPNAAGVFAAHEHLVVSDQAVTRPFWNALGGTDATIGTLTGVRVPGVYVLFQANRGRGAGRGGGGAGGGRAAGAAPAAAGATPPAAPAPAPPPAAAPAPPAAPATPPPPPEGTEGSVVDAFAMKVKNLKDTLAKLDALGIKPEAGATATSATVMSPDKVKVLLTQDASLATPTAASEWVMKVPNPAEAGAWYEKWFGATLVKQGNDVIARIPGVNLHFIETEETLAGTRGRAIDHIGFDVHELAALVTKMQEGGVTVSAPYRTMSLGFITGLSFVTDPWGTYIELNEGYDGN